MIGQDPLRSFRQMARNNHLANRRLLRACLALRPGEWEGRRTGFFPSLKATLNHILIIDWFYVDALEGGTLGPAAFSDPEPCETAERWGAEQGKVDLQLLTLCESLRPRDLDREISIHRGSRVQRDAMADVLLHLFLHQTHHRGQAHAMLSGTSIPPPQLDEFIVSDDAPTRVADLAALGWSEEDLTR